jgi:glutamate--cysteine ligase
MYGAAIEHAVAMLDNPALTPSARVLAAMARDHDNSYVRFVLAQSIAHRNTILALPLSADVADAYERLARDSATKQRDIEATDRLSFEDYLAQYLAPASLSV